MTDREKVINLLEKVIAEAVYPDRPRKFMMSLELAEDTLALLKAQEPRVLSFDEAMLDVNRDVIWIEIKGDPIIEPAINVVATNDSSSVMSPLSDEDDCALRCDRSLYGKTYRCCTSRPTDEQREATPWNT